MKEQKPFLNSQSCEEWMGHCKHVGCKCIAEMFSWTSLKVIARFLVNWFGKNTYSCVFLVKNWLGKIRIIEFRLVLFLDLWKTHSYVYFPNCTRNHAITYTNYFSNKHITYSFLVLNRLRHGAIGFWFDFILNYLCK